MTATGPRPGRDDPGRRDVAEVLAEQATPEVLRDNPFRILGLPADASNRDLRRRAEQIRRDPDVPPAEVERVEAALRRLRDPVRRLADELLWHRPHPAGADDHAAAVTELAGFVDAGDGEAGDDDLVERCGRAIDAMARSLRAPETADHIAARAVALDDPRVGATDARRLLDGARLVVPLVALRMAARAHGAGDTEVAAGLAGAVRARADAEVARDAAATVLAPAIGRVRTLVEAAERAPRDDGEQGAARAAQLLERTADDRALVDALLDVTDPLRAGMVDRLVDQLLADAIASYNDTGDDDAFARLLQQAESLRPGPAARARIDENLATSRANAEWRQCWFCQAAPADPDASAEVDLHGDVERDYWAGHVTWRTAKLPVPRCRACAAADQRRNQVGCSIAAGVPVLAGALSGVAGAAGLVHPLVMLAIWAVLVVGTFVVVLGVVSAGSRRRLLRFPPLQEQLAAGWSLGARPPGTQ